MVEILGALAGLLLTVTVLMPIQIATSIGPVWSAVLVVSIVVGVFVLRRWWTTRKSGRHSARR